jgi:hypothetical protein
LKTGGLGELSKIHTSLKSVSQSATAILPELLCVKKATVKTLTAGVSAITQDLTATIVKKVLPKTWLQANAEPSINVFPEEVRKIATVMDNVFKTERLLPVNAIQGSRTMVLYNNVRGVKTLFLITQTNVNLRDLGL